MKWSNKSSNYIMYQDLVDNMDELIEDNNDKPTLSTIENHVIILPPDTKIEPVIEEHIENTSWKVLAYGIYARVVDVSEIERVSAANE